ncbi:hypothetical protein RhiirA4_478724 [Rhizophagus irregularis]|uniref:Crinkler effector protein N-terminal domain-containing protein n=1 Tax=Rhizophagus irregularis TaxID=588596 RepID=A0A2I1HFE3_9GLOM|nr:hypothetical protein RhiirA4_478724 [Rhizophagus irregularis]
MSLNCLLLGENSNKSFSVDVGEITVIPINQNSFQFKFNKIKISHIKILISCQMIDENIKPATLLLWKVDGKKVEYNKDALKSFFSEDDIKEYLGGELMESRYMLTKYFTEENFEKIEEEIHIIIQVLAVAAPVSATAVSSQNVTQEEEHITIEKIVKTSQIIGNKDSPVITMYKYIERTHIQQFIKDTIKTNLEAFEIGSSRTNDYQGISISGGSGTGKTRHGFETINIIKDLKQIKDGSFEVIHIFVQIFSRSSLAHFDKRPLRDPSTGRYPHVASHVNLVGHYLALAIASYYFTKNYQQESLQSFKELAGNSALDLVTVLRAIRQSYSESKKLLILLQLDEYQRDEYLIANILRYISQLVVNNQVRVLKILIVPICTGTAPIKLQVGNPGYLSVTDYSIYDVHMSPMDIEKSFKFMKSDIDHNMKVSNEFIYSNLSDNPLYHILVGAIRGIAVIMERCALELFKMERPFASAKQAKEIWRILVNWAKRKYSIDTWLDCVGGRKDPQDEEDDKRKKAILKLMFWIHTQKLITKDIALGDSTLEDHEAGGLIFLEKIDDIRYKAKAPLVLIASLVSHLRLASNEVLSKKIDIQHNVNYRTTSILKRKFYDNPRNLHIWNYLIDYKKLFVITDANNDKVEDIDVTTGHFILLVCRYRLSDLLTSHAEEKYKFTSTESDFPVYKTLLTLENFENELEKATESYECFIVMIIKQFLGKVNELPSKVLRDLTGIMFEDQFLEFMGIYGDFTRFIAGEVLGMTMDKRNEEISEMMLDKNKEESEIKIDN